MESALRDNVSVLGAYRTDPNRGLYWSSFFPIIYCPRKRKKNKTNTVPMLHYEERWGKEELTP